MILNTALQAKTRKELPKIVNMFECLLCFDTWLNCPTFLQLDDPTMTKAGYRASIVNQMEMCKSYIHTVKVTA